MRTIPLRFPLKPLNRPIDYDDILISRGIGGGGVNFNLVCGLVLMFFVVRFYPMSLLCFSSRRGFLSRFIPPLDFLVYAAC